MFTKVSIAIAVLVATVSASDDFLGLDRILQAQNSLVSTACTNDASCTLGNCCADYRRTVGASTTATVAQKVCVNPIICGRTIVAAGANHTWTCTNQTTVAAAVGTACSANSACTAAGACCQTRSFSVWNVTTNAGSFCGATTTGNYFQAYAVTPTAAATNFTANITYTSACLAEAPAETSSASLIQMTLMVVFAAMSVVFF